MTFQFLIGTLKTMHCSGICGCQLGVSIPHRYAKNANLEKITSVLSKFQFLIGTLKTHKGRTLGDLLQKFQFLIGTLKTWCHTRWTCLPNHVSIPHRYAKNNSAFGGRSGNTEFQFLIGTLKTPIVAAARKAEDEFQFLIGTLKTMSASDIFLDIVAFQFLIGTLKT